jgi:hypothetical protein
MKQALLALAIALLLAIVITPASGSRPLSAATIAYWDKIGRCETGGNYQMHGSSFSGGLGFANSTYEWWADELGFLARYPSADLAPRLVQIRIADFGYRLYRGYWGCMSVIGRPPG